MIPLYADDEDPISEALWDHYWARTRRWYYFAVVAAAGGVLLMLGHEWVAGMAAAILVVVMVMVPQMLRWAFESGHVAGELDMIRKVQAAHQELKDLPSPRTHEDN